MYNSQVIEILLESSHFNQAAELSYWVSEVKLMKIVRVRNNEPDSNKVLIATLEVFNDMIFCDTGLLPLECFGQDPELPDVFIIVE